MRRAIVEVSNFDFMEKRMRSLAHSSLLAVPALVFGVITTLTPSMRTSAQTANSGPAAPDATRAG